MANKNKPDRKNKSFVAEIRTAIANYMHSEGCSCCRDIEAHKNHEKIIAKLLRVPAYDDGSGFNFKKFENSERNK